MSAKRGPALLAASRHSQPTRAPSSTYRSACSCNSCHSSDGSKAQTQRRKSEEQRFRRPRQGIGVEKPSAQAVSRHEKSNSTLPLKGRAKSLMNCMKDHLGNYLETFLVSHPSYHSTIFLTMYYSGKGTQTSHRRTEAME